MVLLSTLSYSQGIPPKEECPGKWVRDGKDKVWICEGDTPLPVTVTSFTAKNIVDNIVELKWEVTNIVNHNYYIVEHSLDLVNWKVVRQTNSQLVYHKARQSENYYRLVSVDLDQTRHTYKIIFCRIQTYRDFVYNLAGQQTIKEQNKLLIINGFKTIIR